MVNSGVKRYRGYAPTSAFHYGFDGTDVAKTFRFANSFILTASSIGDRLVQFPWPALVLLPEAAGGRYAVLGSSFGLSLPGWLWISRWKSRPGSPCHNYQPRDFVAGSGQCARQ